MCQSKRTLICCIYTGSDNSSFVSIQSSILSDSLSKNSFQFKCMPIILSKLNRQVPGEFYKKKIFLKISQNSRENTCARISFLIKLQASGLTYKRESGTDVFFFTEHLFAEHFKVTVSG